MGADEQTCGKGLAEQAQLHAKVGELMAAVAENLDRHIAALDPTDENARKERAAYESLVAAHRRIAEDLRSIGGDMAGYRDLPMGRHDEEALSSPRIVEAFESFARIERELLALLRERVDRNDAMLADIGRPTR